MNCVQNDLNFPGCQVFRPQPETHLVQLVEDNQRKEPNPECYGRPHPLPSKCGGSMECHNLGILRAGISGKISCLSESSKRSGLGHPIHGVVNERSL